MDDPRQGNGWEAWGNHVLIDGKRQDDCIQDHQKMINALQVELGMIKGKASLYSGITALAVSIVTGVLASIIYNAIVK